MVKINPVNNIGKVLGDKGVNKAVSKGMQKMSAMPYELGAAAIGATGLGISTFFQDFEKTVDEDNYFQLKINSETGKPFEPDVFQKAAGINLYSGNDVLVTAPTGTGKTAIALYAITKNLKEGGRTFYTTPLKALSNEKFLDFQRTFGEENVGLITGDTKINTEAPVIVMTTEVYRNMAASGIFDYSMAHEKGVPQNLSTVIFDELQYLGDKDRGGIWEQSIMFTPPMVQILSLSATIGNNEEINDWIASTKGRKGINGMPFRKSDSKETVLINVPSENRHVPLHFEVEHAAAEIKSPQRGSKAEKQKAKQESARISQTIYAEPRDDAYKALTKKLYEEGKMPAIYFVFSKRECRHLLKYLSEESEVLTTKEEQEEIDKIIKTYDYLGESLNFDALRKGYAIHNAGLLPAQKSLIEELFQKKLVKVVLATETLSAGINMPAKTTVISSPRKPSSTTDGGEDKKRSLTPNEFHQMAGRAGRRGIDTEGFCFPISCNAEQRKFYEDMMDSPSNRLDSNLNLDFSFIANYMSEFANEEEIRYILSKSLYAYNPDGMFDRKKLDKIMDDYKSKKEVLTNNKFINNDGRLTIKGELIKTLNGYLQIPVINIIESKVLADLTPIQLAGTIGGLANIEYRTKDDFPPKPFELKMARDGMFGVTAQKVLEEVNRYASETESLYPGQELKLSPKVMDHLYKWAELNNRDTNSRINWKELYSGELRYTIRDEGSLFKEISMTADLLKQLAQACDTGRLYSESKEDKEYYSSLKEKCQEALVLIQKDPVNTDSI